MKRFVTALTTVAFLFVSGPSANACTGIMLRTADGSVVHGRTVEFGIFIETDVVLVPRGYAFTGQTPLGDGMAWKAKYAALGVIAFDNLAILDGMNEKGLAVGAFYFPTFAEYTKTTPENRAKSMSMSDFPNWLLTSFATVAEVRAVVEAGKVAVAPTVLPGWPPEPQPFHYVVYDKTGASIVIEPVSGTLKIHDNPLGVMSNSPTFDWHMTNLRNYIALNPRNIPPVTVAGETFKQLGQGSGMLGLPGDFTPPARFVRAAVYSATAIPEKNPERGIFQVFHILNNFDIPVGVAREVHADQVHTDYTMLTVARDPQALKFYWKSYEDQTVRSVDMNALNLDAKGVIKISTAGKQPVLDVTSKMK
ncbi:linear amide C-N hydrolase [Candidatus Nitrospira nitrificans]|uniref:Choloylglycine hydrolase n=1 Tax=Candidatus Nitrospira nitrificans TaxID=1742973 RepID=A0A0S4LMA2_9BACT|nr:choloylglycine hydrolase family protein [Candidatus Nitrospira nitrificans]CUS37656.1 Choloylglycine hydrolase [Candidatus Nitrospira nitrificans]